MGLSAGCLQALLSAQLAHAYEGSVQLRLCQALVRQECATPELVPQSSADGARLCRKRRCSRTQLASGALTPLAYLPQARICAADPAAGVAAVHLNAIESCTTCALQSHHDEPQVLEAALSALASLIRAGGSQAAARAAAVNLPQTVFELTIPATLDPDVAVRSIRPIRPEPSGWAAPIPPANIYTWALSLNGRARWLSGSAWSLLRAAPRACLRRFWKPGT